MILQFSLLQRHTPETFKICKTAIILIIVIKQQNTLFYTGRIQNIKILKYIYYFKRYVHTFYEDGIRIIKK